MYKNFFKRIMDFILSLILLVLFSPVILSFIIFLAFANKGKVFFVQPRPGKNERIFKIIKFKTMNDKRDKNGLLLSDDMRLTIIGKLVRATSVDELPQLINVLKGDMSLIGPRPLLSDYLELYDEVQARRHTVRPGITGWAQVNGRNAISWEEKFKLDVFYVDNLSVFLDYKIMFKTFIKVFKREGISSLSSVTIEKFTGN